MTVQLENGIMIICKAQKYTLNKNIKNEKFIRISKENYPITDDEYYRLGGK